ncbi:MAG: hypothetical protein QXS81_04805 [Candidatus Micrarchaeaceae archaeon]
MKGSEMKLAIKARMKPITAASSALGTSLGGFDVFRSTPYKDMEEEFKNMPSNYLGKCGLMKQ